MANQEPIYCVRCKSHTLTEGSKVVQTKNGKYRLTGKCMNCGIQKSRFISSQKAHGLLGAVLGFPDNSIPGLSQIPLLGPLLF